MIGEPDALFDGRRPRKVYAVGNDPDPRFTFANERTFLAWIRTALALMALGVALDSFATSFGDTPRRTLAGAMVGLGILCSALAFRRWLSSERALRLERPLPTPGAAPVLTYGLTLLGAALLVAVVVR
ncbi:DUF202 domain-containing protein [Streptomyces sp. NPDC046821]|uniref:YidH family protein n=1 Tax=Streptomyces sp. NPDC046821 TaxID=3154702 RepID=UPI0033F47303